MADTPPSPEITPLSRVQLIAPPKGLSEQLLAYGAFIISIAAIGISVYTTLETQHDTLSVTPILHLGWDAGDSTGTNLDIYLENKGLGPATIKDIAITLDATSVDSFCRFAETSDLAASYKGDGNYTCLGKPDQNNAITVAANERLDLHSVPVSNLKYPEQFGKFVQDHLAVKIIYCTVYGDCKYYCGPTSVVHKEGANVNCEKLKQTHKVGT